MIVRFSDTEKFEMPEGTGWDYDLGKDIGIAYEELHTRGPQKGQYFNKVCRHIYVVLQGEATFIVNDQIFHAQEKDVVVVEPNASHYIKTSGVKFVVITKPDWYPEQAENIE